MQIIAQCPQCGSNWLLDANAADRRIKCKNCKKLFKVPKLEEVPKAVKIIKQAKSTIYVDQNGKTYGCCTNLPNKFFIKSIRDSMR